MLRIPKKQILERWDAIPSNLKEALFSEQNYDIVRRVCEVNHLSEEKIDHIVTIAGDVIFGFIHYEDLAQEIRKELNLNPEIANSIASEINRKIFAPIRNDLEKVYSPLPETAATIDLRTVKQEVSVEKETAPAAASSMVAQPAAQPVAAARLEISPPKPPEIKQPPSPQPAPPRQTAPVISAKPSEIKQQEPRPAVIEIKPEKKEMPMPPPQLPEIEAPRQNIFEPMVPKPPVKTEPAPETESPFILHKEELSKPVQAPRLSFGGLFRVFTPKEKPKPITAEIEIGEVIKPYKEKPDISKPAGKKEEPRIVHYTQFTTPVEKIFMPTIKSPQVKKELEPQIKPEEKKIEEKVEEKKTEEKKPEEKKSDSAVIDLRTFEIK